MGLRMIFLWIFLFLVVAVLAYIRLAPHDPARWHQAAPQAPLGETVGEGSYVWRADLGDQGSETFARLDQIIRATPRTRRFAGSVAEGQATYITRSKVMGFPDYTTVTLANGDLEVFARLRFGKSDLGVNTRRVKGWLAQL